MANSWTALYVAYSIVWIGVFVYLLYIHMKQRNIDRDLKSLKEEVARHGK